MRLPSLKPVGLLHSVYAKIFVQFVSDLYSLREREIICKVRICLQGYY